MTYFRRWPMGFPTIPSFFLYVSDKKTEFLSSEIQNCLWYQDKVKKIFFFLIQKIYAAMAILLLFTPRHIKTFLGSSTHLSIGLQCLHKFLKSCIYFKIFNFIFRNTLIIGKCLKYVQIHLCKKILSWADSKNVHTHIKKMASKQYWKFMISFSLPYN